MTSLQALAYVYYRQWRVSYLRSCIITCTVFLIATVGTVFFPVALHTLRNTLKVITAENTLTTERALEPLHCGSTFAMPFAFAVVRRWNAHSGGTCVILASLTHVYIHRRTQ